MSLHLSILRRSDDLERPKGIQKRARTNSTELMDDEPEQDHPAIVLQPQVGTSINWHDLIVSQNQNPPNQDDLEKLRSASFSSAESTTLSEDEMDSLQSLMEQAEGFESGFDTFDDYLKYSSSNLEEEEEELIGDKTKSKHKTKSKVKRKLKKLKAKLKNSFKVKSSSSVKQKIKRIHENAVPILRAVSNAAALVFRGVLFLTVNVLIVLTVILSLAIV